MAYGQLRMTPEQFGLMLPWEFWLAWEYYLKERDRSEELMGTLARGIAARILHPFVKGGIRNIKNFWPMPFDDENKVEDPQETLTGEEYELSLDNIKLVADKWLKD